MGTLNKSEADRMKTLLMEAVTTLCRSGIRFEEALRVEGLIAVTVDESDIIVVNVNKSFENPNAAAKKAAAAKAEAEKSAAAENNTDSGDDMSDGGTPRRKRRRKKRRSGAGSEGSDNEESNAQVDSVEQGDDTPSKRLRGDSEAGWSQGESSLDSSHQGHTSQTSRDHGADSMHAIKIEIDSDSEQEDDKDQLAAQLFGAGGDNSLIAVPLDQSGLDGMGSPMPVSMFSASSLPGTSTMNFPSATGDDSYQELPPGAFASPQQGSSKVQSRPSTSKHVGMSMPRSAAVEQYPCPHCEYITTHKHNLGTHILRMHCASFGTERIEQCQKNDGLYHCPYCSYTSFHKDNFRMHISRKHLDKI